MSNRVVEAMLWIKSILENNDVTYQIVGGMAATIHGGSRPVADIDMYIPRDCSEKVLKYVEKYISKPLSHYVEGAWDLEYFQLIYKDQKIEIGLSPSTKIRNRKNGEWVELKTDFNNSSSGDYKGINLPVIPIPDLIEYKALIGREVDLIDIAEMKLKLNLS